MTRLAHLPARAVLFDLDGVLVDSLPVMRLALEAAYRDVMGPPREDMDVLFARYRLHLGKGFGAIMQALGLPKALHEPFKRHSRVLMPYVYPYPGIADLLKDLHLRGWRMGVATGKDEARARELLDHLALGHYFSLVLGSDSVERPKPDPQMAQVFARELGLPADKVIMVGDSPADLQCARRAGSPAVGVAWGYTDTAALLAEHPDHLVASPVALLALLQTLNHADVSA